MAVISLGFVSFFAESYILNNTQNQLKQEAIAFGNQLVKSADTTNWVNVARRYFYENGNNLDYSILFFDSGKEYFGGCNIDALEDAIPDLSSAVSQKLDQTESNIVIVNNSSYAIHVLAISNAYTGEIVGYAVPFFSVNRFKPDNSVLLLYFFALLLAALFAVLLGTFLSDTLTRNIKKLKRRANLLANRQFDVSVPIYSTDEIGELAQSIDIMAESIKEYDLGQKVFLQNASHEFRTPLMSIRGYVEGANDGVFEQEKANEEIMRQVSRLEKLVEEVLYLSKIENTEGIFNMSEITLLDIINEAEDRTHGIVEQSGIRIKVNDIPECSLMGDGDKLTTVVTNIISNCLRYARNEIDITSIIEGSTVSIIVSDDGPGVSPEDLPHLFERFYKGKKGNHGLGLSIAKAIVTTHGGTLIAYNKPAVTDPVSGRERCGGAVFKITLPINSNDTNNGRFSLKNKF